MVAGGLGRGGGEGSSDAPLVRLPSPYSEGTSDSAEGAAAADASKLSAAAPSPSSAAARGALSTGVHSAPALPPSSISTPNMSGWRWRVGGRRQAGECRKQAQKKTCV